MYQLIICPVHGKIQQTSAVIYDCPICKFEASQVELDKESEMFLRENLQDLYITGGTNP